MRAPHLSRRGWVGTVLLLVTLGVTSGCGEDTEGDVRAVVSRFQAAVAAGDGAAACHLLAPETRAELEDSSGSPCAAGILDEVTASGAATTFTVASNAAQARGGGDVVFLSHFRTGWLVTAAACSRRGGQQPYDCRVKGA